MASFNQLGFAGALALTGCMFQVPGLGPTDGATDIVNDADGGQDLTVADILSNPDLQMDLNGDAAPPSPDLAIDGAVVPDLTNIKKTDLAVVPDGTLSLDGLTPADFATPPDLFVPDLIQPDGTVIIPSPTVIHPSTSSIDLPATWAYLFWKDNSGKSVSQYQLCSTSGPMSGITGDANCPNPISVAKNYTVFNALTSGQTVYWKLRGMYSDGSLSSYTPVQTIQINPLLAGWWKMNGNVNDLSGGGNNGVLQNAPGFTNGVEGQAIQLNGINQYVDTGSGLNLQGPLTVSAWVYAAAMASTADTGIVSKGGLNYGLTFHTNGHVYFYINNGGNQLNAPLGILGWHHVVGTFDGTLNAGGMNLYVDGQPVATKASSAATTGAAGSLWFGRYSSSYFNGNMDAVGIYAGALSLAQIINDFCAAEALSASVPLDPACQ